MHTGPKTSHSNLVSCARVVLAPLNHLSLFEMRKSPRTAV
jgi:hypothetical protein